MAWCPQGTSLTTEHLISGQNRNNQVARQFHQDFLPIVTRDMSILTIPLNPDKLRSLLLITKENQHRSDVTHHAYIFHTLANIWNFYCMLIWWSVIDQIKKVRSQIKVVRPTYCLDQTKNSWSRLRVYELEIENFYKYFKQAP